MLKYKATGYLYIYMEELKTDKISFKKAVFVLLFSFFLAPLGIGFAIKYLKSGNNFNRKIAVAIIILTVVSICIVTITSILFYKNLYNYQLQFYQ